MHRFFINSKECSDGKIRITDSDAWHAKKVLRLEKDDLVICCDERQKEYKVRLDKVDSQEVVGTVVEEIARSLQENVSVTIAQGIAKGEKMDLIIQKGTELGAKSFIPVETERMVVQLNAQKKKDRVSRWQKIAYEAAKQSARVDVPVVEPVHSFKELLQRAREFSAAIIPWEGESKTGIKSILNQLNAPLSILFVIGPEGGFSETEIKLAKEAGFIPVTLGERILRTETAGMVVLAVSKYHFGELG